MKTLRAIGALYIVSALWCIFRLDLSASSLGFGLLNPAAQVEYFSVYGGLQLGLGIAMIVTSLQPKLLFGGLYFSLVFSWVLATSRGIGLALYEPNSLMWVLMVLEVCIALALTYAFKKYQTNLV
jgi:hypothetical protein